MKYILNGDVCQFYNNFRGLIFFNKGHL